MKNRFRISLLFLAVTVSGCATQGSLDITRNDIDAVKTRLFSVEKELGGIREESKEKLVTIERDLKSEIGSIRKISADIQATIDSNKSEIQALNGKFDDLSLGVKKPGDELSRYREDADKRIITLEDRILKLQAAVDELNKKISDTTQVKEVPPTADFLYMKGLETFKAGNMAGSRDIFTKFLEQFPKHDLAANAYYWIGETLYSEKNYEPAIVSFQEVIKNYPQQPKAPAAMLKQAMAFKAINDAKSAKYVLKKLVEAYPKSDEAKKAKELLKEIK
jgi:tol-pal system protein YbgF